MKSRFEDQDRNRNKNLIACKREIERDLDLIAACNYKRDWIKIIWRSKQKREQRIYRSQECGVAATIRRYLLALVFFYRKVVSREESPSSRNETKSRLRPLARRLHLYTKRRGIKAVWEFEFAKQDSCHSFLPIEDLVRIFSLSKITVRQRDPPPSWSHGTINIWLTQLMHYIWINHIIHCQLDKNKHMKVF